MNFFRLKAGFHKGAGQRKYLLFPLLSFTGLMMLTPLIAADELVVNGGFEEPVVTIQRPTGEIWSTYYGQNGAGECFLKGEEECHGGALIPGWSAVWTDSLKLGIPEPGRIELQRDPDDPLGFFIGNCPAKEGFQKAELDSHFRNDYDQNPVLDNNVTIFQKIKTCPRLPYVFRYSWKARMDVWGNSDLDVYIDDILLSEHRAFGMFWTDEEHHFIGSELSEMEILFQSCGDGNTLGVFIDAVSVEGIDGTNPELCPDPVNICEGDKPKVLRLLYDGDANGMDYHAQTSEEVIVEPAVVPDFPQTAYIKVFGHNPNEPALFAGMYNMLDLIEVSGPHLRIPPRLKFEIYAVNAAPAPGEPTLTLKQTVQFHTSCSQPLSAGDEFGAIVVYDAEQ